MEHEFPEKKQTQIATLGRSAIATKGTLAAVLVLVLCGISFYAGVAYQKGHPSTTANSTLAAKSNFGTGGGAGGFRMRRGAFGSVTAVNGSNISVQDQRSGNSRTYTIDSSTSITKDGTTASASDIQVGDTVLIRPSGASASVAGSISDNPSFGGPGVGSPPANSPSPSQST